MERGVERASQPVDPGAGPGHPEATHPAPALGMCVPLAFPVLGAAQGRGLETVRWCWDHLDGLPDWNPVKAAYKL